MYFNVNIFRQKTGVGGGDILKNSDRNLIKKNLLRTISLRWLGIHVLFDETVSATEVIASV